MDKENLINLLVKYKNIEELYQTLDNINLDLLKPNEPYIFQKNKIYYDETYELFIIYWKEGYSSPIHSHSDNGCILFLLDGHLEETVFNNDKITNKLSIKPLQKSFIKNNLGVHKIKAITDSITIHIYSPPNSVVSIYEYKDI